MKKSKYRSDWIVGFLVKKLRLNPTFEPVKRLQIFFCFVSNRDPPTYRIYQVIKFTREIHSFIHYLNVSCLFRNIESCLMVGGLCGSPILLVKIGEVLIFLKMSTTSLSCFLTIRLEMHLAILYNFYIITARNKRNHVRSSQFSASVKPWHGFVWWKISKPAEKESRGCKLFL